MPADDIRPKRYFVWRDAGSTAAAVKLGEVDDTGSGELSFTDTPPNYNQDWKYYVQPMSNETNATTGKPAHWGPIGTAVSRRSRSRPTTGGIRQPFEAGGVRLVRHESRRRSRSCRCVYPANTYYRVDGGTWQVYLPGQQPIPLVRRDSHGLLLLVTPPPGQDRDAHQVLDCQRRHRGAPTSPSRPSPTSPSAPPPLVAGCSRSGTRALRRCVLPHLQRQHASGNSAPAADGVLSFTLTNLTPSRPTRFASSQWMSLAIRHRTSALRVPRRSPPSIRSRPRCPPRSRRIA